MGRAAIDISAIRPRKTIVKRGVGAVRVQHLHGFRESPPCSSPELLCAEEYGNFPKIVADSEGFLLSSVGQLDGSRYLVKSELGRGTFGSVFKAWDSATGKEVAIKVVKHGTKPTRDAAMEVAKLGMLSQSELGRRYVVIAEREFFHLDHLCIALELLGPSIHKAMEMVRNQGRQVPMESLRNISKQLCEAVQLLTECGLVHGDLKPENVVLYPDADLDDNFPMIKLIDLGCAAWEGGPPGSVVQTCFYRAPEVMLGLGWTYSCDMWSVACIVLELFEMRRTFDTLATAQHLALMQVLCGGFPLHMLAEAAARTTASHLLHRDAPHRLLWPECSGGSRTARRSPLREQQVRAALPLPLRLAGPSLQPLLAFLRLLLVLDPDQRATPTAALATEWLQSPCPTPIPSLRAPSSASQTPIPSTPLPHGIDTAFQPPSHRSTTPALISDAALAPPPPFSNLAHLWAAARGPPRQGPDALPAALPYALLPRGSSGLAPALPAAGGLDALQQGAGARLVEAPAAAKHRGGCSPCPPLGAGPGAALGGGGLPGQYGLPPLRPCGVWHGLGGAMAGPSLPPGAPGQPPGGASVVAGPRSVWGGGR